jgi:hypothetical protein
VLYVRHLRLQHSKGKFVSSTQPKTHTQTPNLIAIVQQ